MKGITHRIVTVNSCGYRCWRCCCLVAKLCLTFVPPHGLIACQACLTMRIFQARILEWVTISCNKYILLHWWIYMHKDRWVCFLLLLSCSVMSNSWRPHVLQHARLPCPSPSPRVCSNSCPLSQWCHPTISPSVIPYTSCLQSFRASVFSNDSALHIRWPKYWGFSYSISPSNEYSGLISFRIDCFDLLTAQGTLKNILQHYSLKESVLQHSAFFMVQFSHSFMTTGKQKLWLDGSLLTN